MKRIAILAALLLPACSSQNIKDIDANLSADCTRHYTGSLSAGAMVGAQGAITFTIDCVPAGMAGAAKPATTP